MPSKHILPSVNTSSPLSNCLHALETYFTQCQHLKPPSQLLPCPQNIFYPVSTPQTPFAIAPMPSKHISHSANTSNPLFNCLHALKTYFTRCQHLKPPFQLPSCPQNIFHTVPTPHTPFSTAPMPTKHISPSANTSHPLSNCPHALKTHFTQCQHVKSPFKLPRALKTHFTQSQHLKPPFQLPSCPQNILHTVPTPRTPFSTAPMPSKHILPSANTSNPLFNCLHDLKTYFTLCQHLKAPFQLPPCPQNIFYPVSKPQTPFSTASMPSKHFSHSVNTSNPLFNCPHALKTYVTQCQHLKPPFQLPPCPQNIFHTVSTPQTPFSIAPMPSKHISHSANTSNPLFNCPHALKTYFTQCQHRKPPLQLPPCPQKHISPSANTSNPLFHCPHALKTYFTHRRNLTPP